MTMERAPFRAWLESKRESLVEDIMGLVRIPSVSESGGGEYPYGEACAQVLDVALELAQSKGLATENHQYHCGSALLKGATDDEIGIFAHLDVVHEGSGWLGKPYDPYLKDGWLYGRGSADNKGPAIAALYALEYLHQHNIKLNHTVRLFFGCNEEQGMDDIRYYLQHHKAPSFSFVPDARFPVCYAEKGLIEAEFTKKLSGNLKSFDAGVSSNAVPAQATAEVLGVSLQEAEEYLAGFEQVSGSLIEGGVAFFAEGISAHAAMPEAAESAAVRLALCLYQAPFVSPESKEALGFLCQKFADFYGDAMGIAFEDEPSGRLTLVGGTVRCQDGMLVQNLNIRYPVTADHKAVIKGLEKAGENDGWQLHVLRHSAPCFVDPKDPAVEILRDTCRQVLACDWEPYSMGGGTYARMLPKAVAFGPGIPGQQKPGPNGHGGGHQPDECVHVDTLINAAEVYGLALLRLDGQSL